jgi:hypothetical protein
MGTSDTDRLQRLDDRVTQCLGDMQVHSLKHFKLHGYCTRAALAYFKFPRPSRGIAEA